MNRKNNDVVIHIATHMTQQCSNFYWTGRRILKIIFEYILYGMAYEEIFEVSKICHSI